MFITITYKCLKCKREVKIKTTEPPYKEVLCKECGYIMKCIKCQEKNS